MDQTANRTKFSKRPSLLTIATLSALFMANLGSGSHANGSVNFTARETNRCESVRKRAVSDERQRVYEKAFPSYVEVCAASTWQKRGASDGGNYGHAFGIIKGACIVRDASGQPVVPPQLTTCEGGLVGVSSDYILFNVQWLASEGRDFVLYGGQKPGEPLDQEAAIRIQKEANARGIFRGVEFQKPYREEIREKARKEGITEEVARAMWAGDASLGTDFGVAAARGGVDCTRIPIRGTKRGYEDQPLKDLIAHLNKMNLKIYRDSKVAPPGKSEPVGFDYDGMVNNCTSNFSNALAAIGFWPAKDISGHPSTTLEKIARMKDMSAPYNTMFDAFKHGSTLDLESLIGKYRGNPVEFEYFKRTGWMGHQVGVMIEPIPTLDYMNSIYNTTNITNFASISHELQTENKKLIKNWLNIDLPYFQPIKTTFERVRNDEAGPAINLVQNLKIWQKRYMQVLANLNARTDQDDVTSELKEYFTLKLGETTDLLNRAAELSPSEAANSGAQTPACSAAPSTAAKN